jgi:hypothetical protein
LLGLIGMQLLLGKMATCSDNKVKFMRECWGLNGNGEERIWQRNPANFDFLPSATLTVFRICTLYNWPRILWSATAAVGQVAQEPGSKYANELSTDQSCPLYILSPLYRHRHVL